MQALGLIETRGMVAAVESADVMLKTAEVTLIEKTYVGGGLVSIAVAGDVAAVQAAVEAGVRAVRQISDALLISHHVIPRPHGELDVLIVQPKPPKAIEAQPGRLVMPEAEEAPSLMDKPGEEDDSGPKGKGNGAKETFLPGEQKEINKAAIDSMVEAYGLAETLEFLAKLKVVKLRNLARQYKGLEIAGRLISKADKKTLLEEFEKYYKHHGDYSKRESDQERGGIG